MSSIDRDVRIAMPDGITLSTDVFHPRADGPCPTLLQRTCYGKQFIAEYSGLSHFLDAGYRVVFQDCRGSGTSEGLPDHFSESADGRATADWIAAQPWFDGQLGTFGSSYMGFTQWALAATRPPYLKAMSVGLTNSKGGRSWFPGGSFALDICLPWTMTRVFGFMEAQEPEKQARLDAGFNHLPLRQADQVATGQTIAWYQRWMDHCSADDPFWKPLDFSDALDLDIPILLFDGWYDYAIGPMSREFEQRQDAGLPTRLLVGPGTHFAAGDNELQETLAWFDRHLKNATAPAGSSVSVFVMPEVGWTDLPSWPPPHTPELWFLQPEGGLSPEVREGFAPPTPYTYDPRDPTPAVGGPSLRMGNCGPVDNRELEARDDVLTFTSPVLECAVTHIGCVHASLYFSSNVDYFDVYLRMCDVAPTGESINICETIRRLIPADIERDEHGAFSVSLDLSPVAHQFVSGHRIRFQVSGGAHPMYARNTCSGAPLADAVELVVAKNAVYHDASYPSHIVLRYPLDSQL